MTEKKNKVVGILKFREIQTCIQALEAFEKETQTRVEQTPDSSLNSEWERQQGLAVDARAALGAFRLVVDGAKKISIHPDTAYTIHWEGSLEKALAAMGLTFKPEAREEDQRSEWDK
jgi:hypothetical protein